MQVNVLGKLKKTLGEFKEIWPADEHTKGDLQASPGHQLIAVTILFKPEAADEDHLVRLSPGSVRLVTKTADGGWKNNFPLGTVQGGQAWLNKPDDYMFIDAGEEHGVYFIFDVDASAVVEKSGGSPAPKAGAGKAAAAAMQVEMANVYRSQTWRRSRWRM